MASGSVDPKVIQEGTLRETCWCGADRFAPAPHPDYIVCQECGTAKLKAGLATGQDKVTDDQTHFYGVQYWDEHQKSHGFPPLSQRARIDMKERALYWLGHLLEYRLPPGRALEIACAHGGFVKLLSLAGFDALGMEMSPQIIAQSQAWFGVDIVQGPIETVDRSLGTFDAILMFDVLEHLATPVATMREIIARVANDGILVIQTPVHDHVTDADWKHFAPPEHTFIFSRQGLWRLLREEGLVYIAEEPAIFAFDMFVFASRQPLKRYTPDEIAARLLANPDGRIALALLDLYRELERDPAFFYGPRTLLLSAFRSLWFTFRRWLQR